ncbi:MAG: endonuclease/exonuclease/phosphatase family protein [Flavobacteriaceae bacterium]|nr:endonuclease/exonuclease/phosphatase family protein [Flavobacteriaceae bacterium]
MKNLSWPNKIVYVVNILFATILLFSYLLPYISPLTLVSISVLSLAVPAFILINVIFVIYWSFKLKRQVLLSALVLLIGFNTINAFVEFGEKKVFLNDDLKIMSYNVRLFNLYEWKDESCEEVRTNIVNFVEEKEPDIVCFQEFVNSYKSDFKFKYKFVNNRDSQKRKTQFGQAILSNYRIINSGSINFDSSANNAIYADIIIKKDTLRIYSVHLESQHLQLDKENFGDEDPEKLRYRLQNTFKKQADQALKLYENEQKCKYKTIVCGDFNNTAFSWVYHKLKGDKNDAFIEAGKGLGKSFDYVFPMRIDFILTDKYFEINNFKTYNDFNYSDHYPIMVRLNVTPK